MTWAQIPYPARFALRRPKYHKVALVIQERRVATFKAIRDHTGLSLPEIDWALKALMRGEIVVQTGRDYSIKEGFVVPNVPLWSDLQLKLAEYILRHPGTSLTDATTKLNQHRLRNHEVVIHHLVGLLAEAGYILAQTDGSQLTPTPKLASHLKEMGCDA